MHGQKNIKRDSQYVKPNSVTCSHNVYTSVAIPTAWYHFTWRVLLWKFNVNGDKTYFVHVLCPIFLPNFNQIWIFSIVFFIKVPNVKFHEICPVGAALIRMEWPKLFEAFRDYVGIKFYQQTLRKETWLHKVVQDTVRWQAFLWTLTLNFWFHNSRDFACICSLRVPYS
jgi:hypothetical protein